MSSRRLRRLSLVLLAAMSAVAATVPTAYAQGFEDECDPSLGVCEGPGSDEPTGGDSGQYTGQQTFHVDAGQTSEFWGGGAKGVTKTGSGVAIVHLSL